MRASTAKIRNFIKKTLSENLQRAEKVYFRTGKLDDEDKEVILSITNGDAFTKFISDIWLDIKDIHDWKRRKESFIEDLKMVYGEIKAYDKNILPVEDYNGLDAGRSPAHLISVFGMRKKLLKFYHAIPPRYRRNFKSEFFTKPLDYFGFSYLIDKIGNQTYKQIEMLEDMPEKNKQRILAKVFSSENTLDQAIESLQRISNRFVYGEDFTKKEVIEIAEDIGAITKIEDSENILVFRVEESYAIKNLTCTSSQWCFSIEGGDNYWHDYAPDGFMYLIYDFSKEREDPHSLLAFIADTQDVYHADNELVDDGLGYLAVIGVDIDNLLDDAIKYADYWTDKEGPEKEEESEEEEEFVDPNQLSLFEGNDGMDGTKTIDVDNIPWELNYYMIWVDTTVSLLIRTNAMPEDIQYKAEEILDPYSTYGPELSEEEREYVFNYAKVHGRHAQDWRVEIFIRRFKAMGHNASVVAKGGPSIFRALSEKNIKEYYTFATKENTWMHTSIYNESLDEGRLKDFIRKHVSQKKEPVEYSNKNTTYYVSLTLFEMDNNDAFFISILFQSNATKKQVREVVAFVDQNFVGDGGSSELPKELLKVSQQQVEDRPEYEHHYANALFINELKHRGFMVGMMAEGEEDIDNYLYGKIKLDVQPVSYSDEIEGRQKELIDHAKGGTINETTKHLIKKMLNEENLKNYLAVNDNISIIIKTNAPKEAIAHSLNDYVKDYDREDRTSITKDRAHRDLFIMNLRANGYMVGVISKTYMDAFEKIRELQKAEYKKSNVHIVYDDVLSVVGSNWHSEERGKKMRMGL